MLKSKSLSILFTDMKNFTRQMSQFSRGEAMDLIKIHENLLLPVLEAYGGNLVKTIGDSFLVVFESPTNAVLAGMELQRVLREHNAALSDPQKRIEVRVAIHTGEVTVTDNDVYGDAVNIASRILGIAEANEVYFTEAVYLSMNKREVPSSEIGDRYLKGVAEKVKIYKVLNESPPAAMSTPTAQLPPSPAPRNAPTASPAMPEQTPNAPPEKPQFLFGGFWIRFLAVLIDFFIVACACGLLLGILVGGRSMDLNRQGFNIGVPFILYVIFFWIYKSATPGKMILGLKILTEDGHPLSAKTAILRFLGYFVSSVFCFLGFWWIAFDGKKQGWHDKISKTLVVKTR